MAQFNITVNLDWLDEGENLDERLKDEILSGIASKIETNALKSLDNEVGQIVSEKMAGLDALISEKLNSFMEDFFNTPKTITDKWGNVKEEGVTVTKKLADACDNFLLQPVNKDGKPYNGYNPDFATRVDYIVHKTIDHNMEWAIKKAVEDVTKNLQQRVSNEIKAQMGEKLAGILGLDKTISG